jgi:hypothetical protein
MLGDEGREERKQTAMYKQQGKSRKADAQYADDFVRAIIDAKAAPG